MNKNMASKLPNLPCFEAFGVIIGPHVCSYFCLVCGGWAFFFPVKGPRALPAPPPPRAPPHKKGLLEIPVGKERGGGGAGGGGMSVWNLGSARGPFTAKKKAPFR